MHLKRGGFTVAEMVASLAILSLVVGLTTHSIVAQLRFLGGIGEITSLRNQLAQVSGIARSVVWAASPADIVVAQDSALEVRATIGSAVVCASSPGTITITAPHSPEGNALSAFVQSPDVGDRVVALFEDSAGSTWLGFTLATPPAAGAGCLGSTGPDWRLALREQIALPVGGVIRVLRPIRLSLYKASDARWYLGARDWNGATSKFNTIQPVAGPLRRYSKVPAESGLVFEYRDSAGAVLSAPLDPSRIASITIVARGETKKPVRQAAPSTPLTPYGDSLWVSVALRNAR